MIIEVMVQGSLRVTLPHPSQLLGDPEPWSISYTIAPSAAQPKIRSVSWCRGSSSSG